MPPCTRGERARRDDIEQPRAGPEHPGPDAVRYLGGGDRRGVPRVLAGAHRQVVRQLDREHEGEPCGLLIVCHTKGAVAWLESIADCGFAAVGLDGRQTSAQARAGLDIAAR